MRCEGEGMFGAFVIVYLFLGGLGSGMLLLSSASSLAFHRSLNRSELETRAFDAWRNRCFVWGFVVLTCGALCLMLDLGRPERFVMLFLRPSASSVRRDFSSCTYRRRRLFAGCELLRRSRARADGRAQSVGGRVSGAVGARYGVYGRIPHEHAGCFILVDAAYRGVVCSVCRIDGAVGL